MFTMNGATETSSALKLKSFSEFASLMEDLKQPWYVANRPDETFKKVLWDIVRTCKVPKLHEPDKYHCTLIYSKTPCKQPSPKSKMLIPVVPDRFDVFKMRTGENCLVLKLHSPFLQARHRSLMTSLEASYDFPQYLPHITVSYDIGDFDYSKLPVPKQAFNMTGEYCELLSDLD